MADGYRCITIGTAGKQESCHGTSDDGGTAENDNMFSGSGNTGLLQKDRNAPGSTGEETGQVAEEDFTHVCGMEAVDVLLGIDGIDDRLFGNLFGCGYAEINQNILTNILAGSWSAWLFVALSDSWRMSFRTDVKFSSLATCIVERELGPSACMGGFWVKVELNAQSLSIFGVLHELDGHARAHCIVCVCC